MTAKKKHLIELMIDAGVKWQEGAEYAAQDKCDLHVWFYSEKPKLVGLNEGNWAIDVNYENIRKRLVIGCENLNKICRNWHQTIVTREQYEKALAASGCGQVGEMPSDEPAASAMPSIEQLAADYHTKAEEAQRMQSVADEAIKLADDALIALEKAGGAIGLVISIDTSK